MASSPAATLEPGSATPFQRSAGGGAGSAGFGAAGSAGRGGKRHDIVVGRAAHGVARRIGIIGRPLAAGALARARCAAAGK